MASLGDALCVQNSGDTGRAALTEGDRDPRRGGHHLESAAGSDQKPGGRSCPASSASHCSTLPGRGTGAARAVTTANPRQLQLRTSGVQSLSSGSVCLSERVRLSFQLPGHRLISSLPPTAPCPRPSPAPGLLNSRPPRSSALMRAFSISLRKASGSKHTCAFSSHLFVVDFCNVLGCVGAACLAA